MLRCFCDKIYGKHTSTECVGNGYYVLEMEATPEAYDSFEEALGKVSYIGRFFRKLNESGNKLTLKRWKP